MFDCFLGKCRYKDSLFTGSEKAMIESHVKPSCIVPGWKNFHVNQITRPTDSGITVIPS